MPEIRCLNEKTGISIHGNALTLPSGTAKSAKNWKSVRDNVYTKVRGRAAYGTGLPVQNIVQMLQYQDSLICHMGNDTIYYDSDGAGTFVQIAGAYTVPEADYKVQGLELQSNHYITTGAGIYKSDTLGNAYIATGAPKGLSFDLRIINSTNWMTTGNTAAYRVVWSIEDANTNIVDGAPSERQEVTNGAGADRAVELRIYIPTDVTVNYYCKVYRSTQVAGTPPEDFQLVYQASPSAAEIAVGILEFDDILADDWRGASLYTNTTQEGIAKANERPPLANSITSFKGYTFFGNIENRQRLYTALISTASLTSGTSTVNFNDGTNTITFGCYDFEKNIGTGVAGAADNGTGLIRITTTGAHSLATGACVDIVDVGGVPNATGDWSIIVIAGTTFDLVGSTWGGGYTSGGTVDLRLNNLGATSAAAYGTNAMADNLATLIRVTTDELHGLTTGDYVRIYDTVGTTEANGTWEVTVIDTTNFDLVGSTFTNAWASGGTIDLYEDYGATPRFILYSTTNQGTDAQNIDSTAKSLVRTINLCTTNAYWDAYYNSISSDPVGKMEFTSQDLGADAFYLIANSTATGGCFSPNMPIAGTTYVSTNDNFQHAVMWSKEDQPEAVPLINIKKLGSADDPILKIIGLRDSLFVIKTKDGVYRLTGESETSWNWDEFDGTVECVQRNSIVKGENAIYMMSSSGYTKISDVGIEVIGRDTEKDDLKPVDAANFETNGYGWYYDAEKAYKIATYIDQDSTCNDILKEYNVFTLAWTQREYGVYTNDTNISSGIIVDNFEYTAPITGNGLLKERKDLASTDYSLPDIANTITVIDTDNKAITLGTNIVGHDDMLITQGALTKRVTSYDSTSALTLSSVTYLNTNVTLVVADCDDNGAGLIRVTTTVGHTLADLNGVTIAGVTGTVEANGDWIIDVIDATNFDLIGSTFAIAYGAGGTVTNALTIKPGIYSPIKYQIIHGGFPEYEKFFNQLSLFFDDDETSLSKIYIKTSTDADKSTVTTTVDETSESLWEGIWEGKWGDRDITDKSLAMIPDEHARATHLYLQIIHTMPMQRVDLNGYSLIFDVTDARYET